MTDIPPVDRFQPAYVNLLSGSLTTKRTNALGVRNPRHRKRYYWDSEAREYITQRQYIVRSQGWSPEARTRASKQLRIHEAISGRPLPGRTISQRQAAFRGLPEQREIRREQTVTDRYIRARQREGITLTPAEAQGSDEFAAAWRRVHEYERQRRQLIHDGLRDTPEYLTLVSPSGTYAQTLVYLGVRDPDATYNVGDS